MVAKTTAAKEELAKSYKVHAAIARTFTKRIPRPRRNWRSPTRSTPRWRGRSRGGSHQDRLGHELHERLELRHDLAPAREQVAAQIAINEHGDQPPRVPPNLLHARRPRQREESRGQEREEADDEEDGAPAHPPDDPPFERPAHGI